MDQFEWGIKRNEQFSAKKRRKYREIEDEQANLCGNRWKTKINVQI